LSIADLLMGCYLIITASANICYAGRYPENLELWQRSWACLTASFLIALSSLMSTFILFFVTLDRYLYLIYPFSDKRISYPVILTILILL
ncbi:uncharacterized protein TRIADDRAFT_34788, partial [Trichoplax adhaerens]